MKKGRDCLDYCNKLIDRKHETLRAVCMKAQVLNLMGYYKGAIEFIKPYTKQNKENDFLWMVLAEIHEFRDNRIAALDALRKAKAILESKDKGPNYKANMNEIITRISRLEVASDT